MKLGIIGVGQGGGKIASAFKDKHNKIIAINTASVDLEPLNIPADCKIHTKLAGTEGAGKDVTIGERAIIEYEDKIADKIKMEMHDRDMIYVCAGLGGGTGTLGMVQVLRILAGLGLTHGCICTIPEYLEGVDEKNNALLTIHALQEFMRMSTNFRSVLFVDNEHLKQRILEGEAVPHEKLWDAMNDKIYNPFKDLITLTQQSSNTSFDPTDLIKCLTAKGCMKIINSEFDIAPDETDSALATKVIDMLKEKSIFLSGDIKKSTVTAIIVERPPGFDKDGNIIEKMYEEVHKFFGPGQMFRGVYSNDRLNILTKGFANKKVHVYALVGGLPFPEERIQTLISQTLSENEAVEMKKRERKNIDIPTDRITEKIKGNSGVGVPEKIDFSFFNTGSTSPSKVVSLNKQQDDNRKFVWNNEK